MSRRMTVPKVASVSAACALLLLSLGCSTTGPERAAQAAESLQALRAEIRKASDLLGGAVTSLNDLVDNPKEDLNPQYKAFTSSMDALDAQLAVVRKRSETMKAKGQEYFKAWEAQSEEIQSEELKAHAAERRGKLNAHYDDIQAEIQAVSDLGKPLLTSLRDMKTVLGLDLTPAGLKLAAEPATKAKKSAADLRVEVDKLSRSLDDVAALLSPAARPATKPEAAPAEPAPKT